jgi:phospholipase C
MAAVAVRSDWSNVNRPFESESIRLSRRQLLQAAGALGIGGAMTAPERAFAASPSIGQRIVQKAAAVRPAGSDLGAIEHVIFLMMENRSYDHYFGSYKNGRGFNDHPADSYGVFAQEFPGGKSLIPSGVLLPFHLNVPQGDDCTTDLTHSWEPSHQAWNEGKMDSFVKVHTSIAYEGMPSGMMTMGYYTRQDLEFYYAVADAFTLCDAYHCSILGPTHPNRLMANSGWIDPAGTHGGPVTSTQSNPDVRWTARWNTVQEVLEDAGISWKVYNPSNLDVVSDYAFLSEYPVWSPTLYAPGNPLSQAITDNILQYFQAFRDPLTSLHQKAFLPTFPGEFMRDVAAGTLPSVSWLCPPEGFDEHPSSSPVRGEFYTSMVLNALASNPEVWSKTVLFHMYDEADGWFDHLAGPFSWPGTPGEYLTGPNANQGDRGPLGLGFRVPLLVMSPFSRGGHIASEVFDHTSQLQFLNARFGIEVPNVSAFRRQAVGDLTSTLFNSPPDFDMPSLPVVPLPTLSLSGSCNEIDQDTDSGGALPMVPAIQSMPSQEVVPT